MCYVVETSSGDEWISALCDFPRSYLANEIIREHELLQDRLPRKHFKERKTKLLILTAQCLLRTGPQRNNMAGALARIVFFGFSRIHFSNILFLTSRALVINDHASKEKYHSFGRLLKVKESAVSICII
ncbi:unnamed protein product [Musa banksii]